MGNRFQSVISTIMYPKKLHFNHICHFRYPSYLIKVLTSALLGLVNNPFTIECTKTISQLSLRQQQSLFFSPLCQSSFFLFPVIWLIQLCYFFRNLPWLFLFFSGLFCYIMLFYIVSYLYRDQEKINVQWDSIF